MMSQIVQQATQNIIDLLPENEQYYRLDELRSWGVPAFMAERIKVELERNMAESMMLPQTDWANINSEAVQQAWQQFVQAIRAEARLPASYARAVIETAVVDVLDMLVEPRKNIPDVIFGGDDSLNFTELSQRVEAVVVYAHFAALLPRYMQKKELGTLSRDQCAKLIARADEKITANYSPLNWAQTIDPLFKLLDEGVDPSLLRLFFEDKERSNIAEAFEQKDEKLSRAEFIETLTAPDLLDSPAAVPEELAGKEEKQAEDVSDSTSEQPEHSEMNEETEEEGDSAKTEASALALDQEEDRKDEQEQREAPESASDNSGAESSTDEQDSGEDADVTEKDQDQSSGQLEEDDSPEVEVYVESGDVSADENDSLNAAFNDWEEEQDSHSIEPDEEKATAEAELSNSTESEQTTDTDEDRPIWMNFVSEEDQEVFDSEQEQLSDMEEGQSSGQNGSAAKPPEEASPAPSEETTSISDVDELKKRLARHEEYYIEDIFGGSRQAYEDAIEKIADCENWREASKYIQNDIFERNVVNLYSQTA